MARFIIEARGLRTGGGPDSVAFAVAAGEVCALLGRRGADLRAVLEAASGLRRPAAGTVRVRGVDPYLGRDAPQVGTVWREGGWFPGLTAAEVVESWRRWTLDPLPAGAALRRTGLADRADVPFERLSAGEQRLLDLALALVGRSDVLLLDEPTAGLDADAADRVWAVLRRLAAAGATVLLATRDAATACRADRIVSPEGDPSPCGAAPERPGGQGSPHPADGGDRAFPVPARSSGGRDVVTAPRPTGPVGARRRVRPAR